jgi:trafficking protein particle complex subunit 5
VWKHLFGKQADRLEKSADPAKDDEYHIIDNEPLVNRYISVPREMSALNCAAYVAGIVEGVCDGAGFPAKVGAHSVGAQQQQQQQPQQEGGAAGAESEMWPGRTVFLVKFEKEVLEREGYIKG